MFITRTAATLKESKGPEPSLRATAAHKGHVFTSKCTYANKNVHIIISRLLTDPKVSAALRPGRPRKQKAADGSHAGRQVRGQPLEDSNTSPRCPVSLVNAFDLKHHWVFILSKRISRTK
jgi:hypothetical protein